MDHEASAELCVGALCIPQNDERFLLACRPEAKRDILKLATGSYALQRVLMSCKEKYLSKLDLGFLLRWYAKQAVVKP